MTRQADEIRRMAHWHELAAIGHDRGGAPIDAKKHRDTAAMLREYAEGVSKLKLMTSIWRRKAAQGNLCEDDIDDMIAEVETLTTALSGRDQPQENKP